MRIVFNRFGLSSRAQRILLSLIALGVALLIGFLQEDPDKARDAGPTAIRGVETVLPPRPAATPTGEAQAQPSERAQAIANAIRWLESKEGGEHRGHAIARHVGKSDRELKARLDRDGIAASSGFTDLETAAIAIVRTIKHQPNDERVRRWLGDNESQRRLAIRRLLDKPIGRIVYGDGDAADGRTAVAVLTKWDNDGRPGYRLLTAYVER